MKMITNNIVVHGTPDVINDILMSIHPHNNNFEFHTALPVPEILLQFNGMPATLNDNEFRRLFGIFTPDDLDTTASFYAMRTMFDNNQSIGHFVPESIAALCKKEHGTMSADMWRLLHWGTTKPGIHTTIHYQSPTTIVISFTTNDHAPITFMREIDKLYDDDIDCALAATAPHTEDLYGVYGNQQLIRQYFTTNTFETLSKDRNSIIQECFLQFKY